MPPTTTKTTRAFQSLPIGEVHESKQNHRTHFDETKLAELAASIKEHGVLTPILVRTNAKGHEIAA